MNKEPLHTDALPQIEVERELKRQRWIDEQLAAAPEFSTEQWRRFARGSGCFAAAA